MRVGTCLPAMKWRFPRLDLISQRCNGVFGPRSIARRGLEKVSDVLHNYSNRDALMKESKT
jgi:hypothetical protein